MASGNLPRDLTVLSRLSENAVWVWHLDAGFNDRFGDMKCATPKTLPHAPKNAASAKLIFPRTGLSALQTLVQSAANVRKPPILTTAKYGP